MDPLKTNSDSLEKDLGYPLKLSSEQWKLLEDWIAQGNRFDAIRHVCLWANCSMGQAKSIVEKYQAKLHQQDHNRFPHPHESKGCTFTVGIFLTLTGLGAAWAMTGL